MNLSPRVLISAVVVGLVITSVGVGVFFFDKYQRTKEELARVQNPAQYAQEEAKKLETIVGMIIALPEGEVPTVATVTDKEKLAEQAFFKRAENGDKILIYTQAKKAILYRPGQNKVIEVAPVNIGQGAVAGASDELAASVVLYNGTTTEKITRKVENLLPRTVKILSRDYANKRDYGKTLVVDLAGKKQEAEAIAKLLKAQVAPLPEGEATPSADLLIIVGADFRTD